VAIYCRISKARNEDQTGVDRQEHDITLHGQANHRDLSDPDDRFFLRIEVAHVCRSSDDTSRRLRDALEDRAREGRRILRGSAPTGTPLTR
jgi:DNA invertase Pin-like site-specific DNA recombinase